MWTEQNKERIVRVRAAIKAAMESLTEAEQINAAEHNQERGGAEHLVAVPAAFWNDHHDRELDLVSVEVRSSSAYWGDDDGSYVVLVMGDDELRELVDDAAHYSTSFDEDEYGALMESARRTIVALWEQKSAMLQSLADRRTDYDNLAWALGIEQRRKGVVAVG